MAVYLNDVSRTFGEYLLIPGLTTKQCIAHKRFTETSLVKHNVGESLPIELNIPFVSAIMQSVSGTELAIELAVTVVFHSFSVHSQSPARQRWSEE